MSYVAEAFFIPAAPPHQLTPTRALSPLWQLAGVARVLATRCGSFLFGWVLGSLCRTTPLQAGLRRSQLLRVAAGLPLLFALRYLTLLQVYNTDPDSQVQVVVVFLSHEFGPRHTQGP